MWEQGATSVANKSEYIREVYALRKSLQVQEAERTKYWMGSNVYIKRIRRSLSKCTTSIVCVSYESDVQLK